MKRISGLLLAFSICTAIYPAYTQQPGEVKNRLTTIADGSEMLWGIRFEPNIAVIYPSSKQMVLYRRSGQEIVRDSMMWDRSIPTANSTTEYNGVRYLTLVGDWLGKRSVEKTELTAHESFHVYQDSLGIIPVTSANSHLDTPEGRALLHMEFDALRKALRGDRKALRKALEIRMTRRKMFPANNEAVFELHEGLAQYTGIRISRPTEQDAIRYASEALDFNEDRGYTNSFAYMTGPAYALLLDRYLPEWRTHVAESPGLSELLSLTIQKSTKLHSAIGQKRYKRLLRDEQSQSDDPSEYETWLANGTDILRIANDGIGIVFNPNDRITQIGGKAVLLRNVSLRGAWGSLSVQHGIVRMNDWSEFLLAAPEKVSGNVVIGPTYRFDLAPGWQIVHSDEGWELKRQ